MKSAGYHWITHHDMPSNGDWRERRIIRTLYRNDDGALCTAIGTPIEEVGSYTYLEPVLTIEEAAKLRAAAEAPRSIVEQLKQMTPDKLRELAAMIRAGLCENA